MVDARLLAELEQAVFSEIRAAPASADGQRTDRDHATVLYARTGELVLRLDDGDRALEPDAWAFVPAGVPHAAAGEPDTRYLDVRVPSAGSDRGAVTIVSAGAVAGTGEPITDRPNRRATLLLDTDELTVTEFSYGVGERGAKLHVHREHADGFLVVEGEFAFHNRDETLTAPAGTLVLFPPLVVHGFDNDSGATARCFNFHLPASGFADYLRGQNPGFDQHDPPADGGVDPSAIVVVRLSE